MNCRQEATKPERLQAIASMRESTKHSNVVGDGSERKSDSSPSFFSNLSDLTCISGDDLRRGALARPAGGLHSEYLDPLFSDKHYALWINSMVQELVSNEAKQIVQSRAFSFLEDVFNCGAAHTKLFGAFVDHTRRDHCIHAAWSLKDLHARARLDLSPFEYVVLENVMALHDPHRFGSHSLDDVYASLPSAPPIADWGWGKDFHEYHGAQLVAKDSELKSILGGYWADVLAVLTKPDLRDPNDPCRIADFGTAPQGKLSKERIELLYSLKDLQDRLSYIKLDLLRSGMTREIISRVFGHLWEYENSLFSRGGELCSDTSVLSSSSSQECRIPGQALIAARQLFGEHIGHHPSSSLVSGILRQGAWKTLRNSISNPLLDSPMSYLVVKNLAMDGNYKVLFGEDTVALLNAPRSQRDDLGLEDVYAPLLTLSLTDFDTRAGQAALNKCVSPKESAAISGIPRNDMSIFEYGILKALQSRGLASDALVSISNRDGEKIFDFRCAKDAGSESHQLVLLGVRSSPEAVKVVVVERAVDEEGNWRDLRPLKEAIDEHLVRERLISNPNVLKKYDPRALCRPSDPSLFRREARLHQRCLTPAWIAASGCGLTN